MGSCIGLINEKVIPSGCYDNAGTIQLAGTRMVLGVIDIPCPHFDSSDKENSGFVLVRVNALSCNYRDKAIIIKSASKQKVMNTAAPLAFFGSDFVGTVVEIGPDVTGLKVGDRVIPDCAFPEPPAPGVAPGVTTNEASKGWLRLHHSKLARIPDELDDLTAAGFSIGGQTSRSLVRKTIESPDDEVLILSARSNTGVFILSYLSGLGVSTTALSTSNWSSVEKSKFPGVDFVKASRGNPEQSLGSRKFDVIIDPFFDLHLDKIIPSLKSGGRYITCGYKNQHKSFESDGLGTDWKISRKDILQVMINNISLIGNCIGTKEDLRKAISDYAFGGINLPIDSVFEARDAARFLNRTYNDFGRFGKSIIRL